MAYRCLDGDRGRGERERDKEREEVLLTISECDCDDCSIATRKACSKLQHLTEAAGASALVMIPCRPSPKITALQASNRFKPKCRVIECMSPCEDMSDMSWFPVV